MRKVALYMRLSKHDKKREVYSESIQNQQSLLERMVKKDAEFSMYEKINLIDDGYTGMDENRPSLIYLLQMIKRGEVVAVFVKDLSRLSRNALFLAHFREEICPTYHVTIVSVGDCYDSRKSEVEETGIRLRSLFYEYYAKDISQKVRKALIAKKELGEYAVARPPFGYRAVSSTEWVIKEDEAACVKRIYEGILMGMSQKEIAQKELRYQDETQKETDVLEQDVLSWNIHSENKYRMYPAKVNRILHNPVYCGYHVWHKNERSEVSVKKNVVLPSSQWRITKGRHPAIITKSMYDRVQGCIGSLSKRIENKNRYDV